MLTRGSDAGLSPGGKAGAREQCRLHFTVGQMLALSKTLPISRSICISYFKFFGTSVDCSTFKIGVGMGKRATIIISGLRYFPFYLQSSQCSFYSCSVPSKWSLLPSFSKREDQPLRNNSPQQVLDLLPKKLLHPPTSVATLPPCPLPPLPDLFFSRELVTPGTTVHIFLLICLSPVSYFFASSMQVLFTCQFER